MRDYCGSCREQNQCVNRGRGMNHAWGCGMGQRTTGCTNPCNSNSCNSNSCNSNSCNSNPCSSNPCNTDACKTNSCNVNARTTNNGNANTCTTNTCTTNTCNTSSRSTCSCTTQCNCKREACRKPSCPTICNPEIRPVDSMGIGMAYVPWQKFDQVMCAEQGMAHGTIFEELVLPFYGADCWNGKGMKCR